MIKRNFYKIGFVLFFAISLLHSAAQDTVVVRASVDKRSILIGEHFNLRLEADIPETEAIRFFRVDTLPHFEFLDKQKIDTTNTSVGTVLVQVIKMTSFDSGHWVIPAFFLDGNIRTDSIGIDVGFTSPFDSSQAYHDIKDVIDVEVEEKESWLWYIIGGSAVLLAIILWLLLKKKPKAVKPEAPPINPYDEAIAALDKLSRSKGDTKQYYSALIDIFRIYIAKSKGISSLQKTTDDLVVQLKTIPMKKESFDRLAQGLRLGDFVKFARYEPTTEDDGMTYKIIRDSIIEIEQIK